MLAVAAFLLEAYRLIDVLGSTPGKGRLATLQGGLNVGMESGMFNPGVRHHHGASARSSHESRSR